MSTSTLMQEVNLPGVILFGANLSGVLLHSESMSRDALNKGAALPVFWFLGLDSCM